MGSTSQGMGSTSQGMGSTSCGGQLPLRLDQTTWSSPLPPTEVESLLLGSATVAALGAMAIAVTAPLTASADLASESDFSEIGAVPETGLSARPVYAGADGDLFNGERGQGRNLPYHGSALLGQNHKSLLS